MPALTRRASGWALAALLLGALTPGTARGQGADDDLANDPAQQRERPVAGAIVFNAGRVRISERNIENWIYGNEYRGRDWLSATLKEKVNELDRACRISETQRQKLILAGEGDIQRFERQVEELKAKCDTAGGIRPEQYNDIFQKTRPLQRTLQLGLFGSGSLFQKTLLTVLGPQQSARLEQVDRDRRAYRYRARVEMCVAQLDAVVSLRDEQRRRLVELVLERSRPPKVFGTYDRFLVLVQMSRVPEETLKSVFDSDQWPEVKKRLTQANRLIPALKRNGMIFDDDADAKEAEAGPAGAQFEFRRN
jgi:hypothetical protein